MGLLDSVLGAVSGKTNEKPGMAQMSPLIGMVVALLAQSGGIQGLMNKFSQAGMGDVFSKWVSTGPNPPVSSSQVQQVLGSEQIRSLAAKLGIDPARASEVLAEHLPTVVDQMTPQGKIDPSADTEQSLTDMLPSLFGKLMGGQSTQA